MGKIQSADAVSKHVSTSFFGNITALAESPKKDGLLWVGTDDGLIQVTEDGGRTWRKIESFPSVPDGTYVARLVASEHAEGTVYAAFDNHKNADFKPYLMKSVDHGRNWAPITGDLPERGSVLAVAEDPVKADLLFVGTEFSLFFTADGGRKWHRLKAGMPTIPVRDLVIQRPMVDLVVGTFGRGFYILDDFSALRAATDEAFAKPAHVFPIRDGFLYPITGQFGWGPKGFLGEAFYSAPNPAYGVTFTFHLKDSLKSLKAKRKEAEKRNPADYPKLDALRAEEEEEAPAVLAEIRDSAGALLRTLPAPAAAGVHRLTWDLRLAPVTIGGGGRSRGGDDDDSAGFQPGGAWTVPGDYTVSLVKREAGKLTPLAGPEKFKVRYVGQAPLPPDQLAALVEFQKTLLRLQRDFTAAATAGGELAARLDAVKAALDVTPEVPAAAKEKIRALITAHRDATRGLTGDRILDARNENVPMSTADRVGVAAGAFTQMVNPPTGTQKQEAERARTQIADFVAGLRKRIEEVKTLEDLLDQLGGPPTPGRLPK
jgi:hypothetical protein